MNKASLPAVRDLVLVGGGHAHVQVLRAFGMRPEPGVRLTLISPEVVTPYSGMLPGFVAGEYSAEEIHIDLVNLCRFANARLILATATGINTAQQSVSLADRPDLRYDIVSFNCGAVPASPRADATVVKPIADFLPKWAMLQNVAAARGSRIALVGAGAGGVELAFAMRQKLPEAELHLIGPRLLSGSPKLTQTLKLLLANGRIVWHKDRVSQQTSGGLELSSGARLEVDEVVWVTGVKALEWLASSDLTTDKDGFITVGTDLRSVSHANVFAVGDTADLADQPRAKSGVFAVRQGPRLAENLRAALRDEQLRPYRAQVKHLVLLGLGTGQALATRGDWVGTSSIWWRLKQRIDRRFMTRFNELPIMPTKPAVLPGSMQADLPSHEMRCGGCGAKVAAEPLRRVLARLPLVEHPQVTKGIGDDAAELIVGTGRQLLTVDGFRAMLDDPYLFGRIATHHSLNDIFAMGGRPLAALALVTVPLMAEAMVEEELFQLLSGAVSVLNEHEVALVGGHSAEGLELSIGLTVTGEGGDSVLHKDGAEVGQKLILTKPLGTGVVLAGAMQAKIVPAYLQEVLDGMDQSNAPAIDVFRRFETSALTDVTGFGLLGHLGEMLRPRELGVTMMLEQVPFYPGIGLFSMAESSLQQANELNLQDYELGPGLLPSDVRIRALMDPQTSGGLLASVPAQHAEACVQALREMGFDAASIGEITNLRRAIV